jgi:ribosome recycling factor
VVKDALKEAEFKMKASLQALVDELARIRTGRASPSLIEGLLVEYYGTPTKLIQLATITVPEPRQLLIKPFDASSVKDIEKAIITSDLGLNPMNDGKSVRLSLPALTEERRRDLTKVVHGRAEEARVAVRNARRDLIKDMREFESEKMISEDDLERGEKSAQIITDKYIEEIEDRALVKEKEVMEV